MINCNNIPVFTALKNTSNQSLIFGDTLRGYLFTYDHLDSYDNLLMKLPLFGSQLEWCLAHDPDEIYSNLPDIQSPIFVLCRSPHTYKHSISACRYFQQNGEKLVFLVTTFGIVFSQSLNTQGVRICTAHNEIDYSVQDISQSILTTCMLPSIIGINATDVFDTISNSDPKSIHVFSAYENEVSQTINNVTSKIRSALVRPKGQYIIGYIAHDKNTPVGLQDYKILDDFLRSHFSDHPNILIAVVEMENGGCYCNLMVG